MKAVSPLWYSLDHFVTHRRPLRDTSYRALGKEEVKKTGGSRQLITEIRDFFGIVGGNVYLCKLKVMRKKGV